MTPLQAAAIVRRLGERNPNALALARLLSFAALADPALIRRMRLEFAPGSTAADEADLWFSDLVQSRSPAGVVFFSEVAEILRNGLTGELAEQAWQRTRERHPHLRRAIQMEEELTYLGSAPAANQSRIQALLGTVISALLSGAQSLANWAGRAVPRLPAAVQSMDSASALRIASELRLGRNPDLRGMLGAANRMPSWIGALLPALPRVRLRVSLAGQQMVVGPLDPNAPPSQSIVAPDTPTVAVEARWTGPDGPRRKILMFERGGASPPEKIDPGPVELVTLANERWTITPQTVLAGQAVRPAALAAYTDGYAVTLHWRTPARIEGCQGFVLARRRNPASDKASLEWVASPGESGVSEFAIAKRDHFQRWRATDVPPERDTEYSYQVVPVAGSPGQTELMMDLASPWTPGVWVGAQPSSAISVAFNRSFEDAAALGLTHENILALGKMHFERAIGDPSSPARNALGGDLLASLRNLLTQAKATSQTVYVAMYEIDDPEILQLLSELGSRANVVLSNGPATAERPDPNAQARAALRSSGVQVYDRMFRLGTYSHNKFLVLAGPSGAHTVWTGNVSLESAALCARSNAAVTVQSPALAEAYLAYWKQLAALPAGGAKFSRPTAGLPSPPVTVGSATVRPWFTPALKQADLLDAARYIERARQGILFMLSAPGQLPGSLLSTVLNQKNLFIQGIARNSSRLTLYGNGKPLTVSPSDRGVPSLASVPGKRPVNAALQSRMIVIDPMGSHPVVLIGSHGFGVRGSRINEENFLILENDTETARRCAANIDRNYWFHAMRARTGEPEAMLKQPNHDWQDAWFLPPQQAEAAFWIGEDLRTFVTGVPPSPAELTPAVKKRASAKQQPAAKKAATKPAASKRPAKKSSAAPKATRRGNRIYAPIAPPPEPYAPEADAPEREAPQFSAEAPEASRTKKAAPSKQVASAKPVKKAAKPAARRKRPALKKKK